MFVYLRWFDWFIIKVYNSAQWRSFLPTKYNLLSLFVRVWIKVHFPFKSPVTISSKSSLRSLAEVLISLTTENREVSSANSLHSLLRPSDKSLIYVKNKKSARIDPWGTPALTSGQNEHWPFKTTFCFLLWKKSSKMFMISLLIPFWRSLKIRPSCHTCQKPLKYKKISHELQVLYQMHLKFRD